MRKRLSWVRVLFNRSSWEIDILSWEIDWTELRDQNINLRGRNIKRNWAEGSRDWVVRLFQNLNQIYQSWETLFHPLIGPSQMLLLWARGNLEAMAMKGYSAFLKAPVLLEPHDQFVYCHIKTLIEGWGLIPRRDPVSVLCNFSRLSFITIVYLFML